MKQPGKPPSARARLEKELKAALSEVDDEGLLFLLRQAQVLVHNRRVEELQEEARRTAGPAKPAGRAAATPRARPPAGDREPAVSIETAEGGTSIFLVMGSVRKVLSPVEMKRLVRICWGAESRSEALRQLFTVLAKERKDILADAVIGNPDNPLLVALFDAVRARYRLEDR